jgi:sterol desaturase/sphingolipid hydroxylase (fatty acid hydroxylase superfamily)
VHHARNAKYIDKNYGSTLIIWDRMFNTFVEEDEEPIYGLTKEVKSYNPVYLNFHEWIDIFRDVKNSKTWKERFNNMFGRPK